MRLLGLFIGHLEASSLSSFSRLWAWAEEVVEEEEEEEEEAITDANGRSMATGMSAADVWVSCEAIAAGGWRTVSLLTNEEEGVAKGGGATSTTGTGSLGLFGFGLCEVKLARGRSEPGTE